MGKFIGRDMLLDHLDQVSRITKNEMKGLQGEIAVGDLLTKYLPDDTYIIAQPVIGKYEPDFLVISPRYGFRLIEVKNWSINSINNITSNGNFSIASDKQTPLSQLRKHVDNLKSYLNDNFPHLGNYHTYIGYVNIQYGFTKREIDEFTNEWSAVGKSDFLKYHIFSDELNGQLDERLKNATKFKSSKIPIKHIEDIVKSVRISNRVLTESDIKILIQSEQIEQNVKELKEMNEQTKKLLKEIQSNNDEFYSHGSNKNTNTRNAPKKGKPWLWVIGIIVFVILIAGFSIFYFNDKHEARGNSSIDSSYYNDGIYTDPRKALKNKDNALKVEAKVKSFYYDESSGNKFLKLESNGFTYAAIIYKGTKTPYINEGDTYIFYGLTQEYNGEMELRINNIE
ncbi:nuclease-related domain-containing protein [Salirhabdus sp. Marseille-P4669]|uniref:nuclease-related domain-containing protein n=1 Tax=Salirhabdus sp. Marseille-P4669 TaxID=2042310 RepID=UPI000C7C78F5|nr:nuclease-related domain-containing protein [Salirhabdus sp. Marseille-P4669]